MSRKRLPGFISLNWIIRMWEEPISEYFHGSQDNFERELLTEATNDENFCATKVLLNLSINVFYIVK